MTKELGPYQDIETSIMLFDETEIECGGYNVSAGKLGEFTAQVTFIEESTGNISSGEATVKFKNNSKNYDKLNINIPLKGTGNWVGVKAFVTSKPVPEVENEPEKYQHYKFTPYRISVHIVGSKGKSILCKSVIKLKIFITE